MPEEMVPKGSCQNDHARTIMPERSCRKDHAGTIMPERSCRNDCAERNHQRLTEFLQAIELRPAVRYVVHVIVERRRLIVHAEWDVGRILPERDLHRVADLLLRRWVGCVEPGGVELLD